MKKSKLIIIIGVALVVIIGAVVAFLMLNSNKEPEPVVIEYFEYNLDENYSNLLGVDGKQKIVKYKVCIQYTGEKTNEILEKNKTKLMNNVDEIMRGTKAEDLDKPNGKEKLRGRIKNMVMDSLELDDTVITDIFLQPFVIQ